MNRGRGRKDGVKNMWNYEKRLQYPVKITQTNPKIAQVIISQFGGPDGELAASMRYLSQRYTMPYKEVTGILTDIGTEESVLTRCSYEKHDLHKEKTTPTISDRAVLLKTLNRKTIHLFQEYNTTFLHICPFQN